jgi:hypothetical protein
VELLTFLVLVARLLNFGAGFLDSEGKKKLGAQVAELENLKHDQAAVHDANIARDGVRVDADSLRTPDADSRP